jgi:F-type H+-transporting ATPase subunit epsilon
MNLTVLIPSETLVDRPVAKVVAEAPNGFFCLLPRHVDFATAIVPGLLAYMTDTGEEIFLAVDAGILIKQADRVWVSTRNAVAGEDLDRLEEAVTQQFRQRDAEEEKAQQAMNKIQAGFVRRFLSIQAGA